MKNNQITGEDFRTCLIAATNYLEANKEMVNNMNVFPVPDGDTGTNMSLTMKSAVKQVQQHPDSSVSALAKACATGALMEPAETQGLSYLSCSEEWHRRLQIKRSLKSQM